MKFRSVLFALAALLGISGIAFYSPAEAGPAYYLSPQPNARYIHPETSLAIREGHPLDPGASTADLFRVTGSRSGAHTGRTVLSTDGQTLLFYPDQPFDYRETVHVEIGPGLQTSTGAEIAPLSYSFETLSRPVTAEERAAAAAAIAPELAAADQSQTAGKSTTAGPPTAAGQPAPDSPYHTYPEFQGIMTATVSTQPQGTADGHLFVSGVGFSQRAAFILEESGEPLFIQLADTSGIITDLKVVSYSGQDHLVFHSGDFLGASSQGTVYLLDSTYTLVETWTIDNGYQADFHDFLLLENGHAILLGYLPTPYDLSPYGGPADGILIDVIVQEQDADKNVIFEWHGLDHFNPEDTYLNLADSPVDYAHGNALEVDFDGALLLSCRNIDEITKIDRGSGMIIWRLGGSQNQFTFTNDIGFSRQHDIRRLPNGNITLFDNGNTHTPAHSRAVEYAIDEIGKTITLVWEYPEDTSLFAPFMGNAQRFDNGNTLIGWGAIPMFTEVHADSTVAYEVMLSDLNYRAYRFEWSAVPAEPPRAALITAGDPLTATVFASWNGATEITGYEVYAGPDTAAMSLVTTAPRSGFETAVPLTGLDPDTCVFQVRPVHADSTETPFSNFVYRIDNMACLLLQDIHLFPFIAMDKEIVR